MSALLPGGICISKPGGTVVTCVVMSGERPRPQDPGPQVVKRQRFRLMSIRHINTSKVHKDDAFPCHIPLAASKRTRADAHETGPLPYVHMRTTQWRPGMYASCLDGNVGDCDMQREILMQD